MNIKSTPHCANLTNNNLDRTKFLKKPFVSKNNLANFYKLLFSTIAWKVPILFFEVGISLATSWLIGEF
jgi:hypothetical protein